MANAERKEWTVTSATGAAQAGVSVTINYTGAGIATIYSDEGVTPKANPMTSDSEGKVWCYLLDGDYDLLEGGVTKIRDFKCHANNASSGTATGHIELATDAEVLAGTDGARAVTPAGMRAGVVDWLEFDRKAADTDIDTDDTVNSDPDITMSVASGTTWEWYLLALITCTDNTGFKWKMTSPAVSSSRIHYEQWDGTTIDAQGQTAVNTTITWAAAGGAACTSGSLIIRGEATFTVSGTLVFQWAQATSNGDTTSVLQNSYWHAKRIA